MHTNTPKHIIKQNASKTKPQNNIQHNINEHLHLFSEKNTKCTFFLKNKIMKHESKTD
jgi:23S rRNA maturation-related 3'-5' exoribonuclease YhaM